MMVVLIMMMVAMMMVAVPVQSKDGGHIVQVARQDDDGDPGPEVTCWAHISPSSADQRGNPEEGIVQVFCCLDQKLFEYCTIFLCLNLLLLAYLRLWGESLLKICSSSSLGTAAVRSFVSLGTAQSLSDSGLQGCAHSTCVLDLTIATQGSSWWQLRKSQCA